MAHIAGFSSPEVGRRVGAPLCPIPLCLSGSLASTPSSQCPGPLVVPVSPVAPVSSLLGPSSLSPLPGFPSIGVLTPQIL